MQNVATPGRKIMNDANPDAEIKHGDQNGEQTISTRNEELFQDDLYVWSLLLLVNRNQGLDEQQQD